MLSMKVWYALNMAVVDLHMHGFMTESEYRRIGIRLDRKKPPQQKKSTIIAEGFKPSPSLDTFDFIRQRNAGGIFYQIKKGGSALKN